MFVINLLKILSFISLPEIIQNLIFLQNQNEYVWVKNPSLWNINGKNVVHSYESDKGQVPVVKKVLKLTVIIS